MHLFLSIIVAALLILFHWLMQKFHLGAKARIGGVAYILLNNAQHQLIDFCLEEETEERLTWKYFEVMVET